MFLSLLLTRPSDDQFGDSACVDGALCCRNLKPVEGIIFLVKSILQDFPFVKPFLQKCCALRKKKKTETTRYYTTSLTRQVGTGLSASLPICLSAPLLSLAFSVGHYNQNYQILLAKNFSRPKTRNRAKIIGQNNFCTSYFIKLC